MKKNNARPRLIICQNVSGDANVDVMFVYNSDSNETSFKTDTKVMLKILKRHLKQKINEIIEDGVSGEEWIPMVIL